MKKFNFKKAMAIMLSLAVLVGTVGYTPTFAGTKTVTATDGTNTLTMFMTHDWIVDDGFNVSFVPSNTSVNLTFEMRDAVGDLVTTGPEYTILFNVFSAGTVAVDSGFINAETPNGVEVSSMATLDGASGSTLVVGASQVDPIFFSGQVYADAVEVAGFKLENITFIVDDSKQLVVNNEGSMDVVVNVDGALLSYITPQDWGIAISNKGEVVTNSSLIYIQNASQGNIKVTGVRVVGANGYALVDYDAEAMSSTAPDTKSFSVKFGLDADSDMKTFTTATGEISAVSTEWKLSVGGYKAIHYDYLMPTQTVDLVDVNVATVIITMGWDN